MNKPKANMYEDEEARQLLGRENLAHPAPASDVDRGRSKTRTPQRRVLRTPPRSRSRSRSRLLPSHSRREREASHYHSRYRDKQRQFPDHSPRDSTREFMSQFTNILKTISTSSVNRENFSNTNVVPEFDPSLKNQSINNWLTKVNECAELYEWNERQIVHYALPKLVGVAKKWYEGLPTILHSWSEWQTKMRSAFPSEENYGQMLADMLAKRARFGESFEEYYYEKVALLNRCDILGKRAVECILHGIDDRSVRLGAEAAQFRDPDKLLSYLRNVKPGTFGNGNSGAKRARVEPTKQDSNTNIQNKPNGTGLRCYNCKQYGHVLNNCPKPIKKCTNCSLLGHLESECFRKKKDDVMSEKENLSEG